MKKGNSMTTERGKIEERLRKQFEAGLGDAIERQLEAEDVTRREQIETALRGQFEETLEEAIDNEIEASVDA